MAHGLPTSGSTLFSGKDSLTKVRFEWIGLGWGINSAKELCIFVLPVVHIRRPLISQRYIYSKACCCLFCSVIKGQDIADAIDNELETIPLDSGLGCLRAEDMHAYLSG